MKAEKKTDALENPPRLSESEWRDLSKFVHQSIGIKLSEAKRVFLVSRLLKRLRATGAHSFRDYFRLVQGSKAYSGEHQELVNAVTTNKTDFFREPEHFDVLARWLNDKDPNIRQARANGLRVWCAAASTGEEPYTIAAVLRENLTAAEYDRVQFIASDIDTNVLEFARRGVYSKEAAESVEATHRMKMFVHGTGAYHDKYRVRRELRQKVQFVQLNLISPEWRVGKMFDLILCRNVLIYFDRPTQQQVVTRLLERIAPYGVLFLGHSESLNSLSIPAKSVAHAVYAPLGSRTLTSSNSQGAAGVRQSLLPPRIPTIRPPSPVVSPRSVPPISRSAASSHRASGASSLDRAEILYAGESRVEASQWLSVLLDQSLLLLLYSERRKIAMVCHLEIKNKKPLAFRIRENIVSLFDVLGAKNAKEERLRAKVVLAHEASLAKVTEELTRLGIQVAATKVVHDAASVWIEPKSERILLRKPTPRTKRPPPLPRSRMLNRP
jgi:chemotaxis protein methyltransferase CheR